MFTVDMFVTNTFTDTQTTILSLESNVDKD